MTSNCRRRSDVYDCCTSGGGVYAKVSDANFNGNANSDGGGGIYLQCRVVAPFSYTSHQTAKLTMSTFNTNKATGNGGGIYISMTNLTLAEVLII